MWDFFDKGGILMWPILICSVLSLAIFSERTIWFLILDHRGAGVAGKVASLLQNGDRAGALAAAKANPSPMGRILVQAMGTLDQDRETLETVIVNAIETQVRDLSRYLQALATIGNIAPLLGLLGTVLGMIKAFMVIQLMGGKVNAAVLAGGIWEAMLTTAFGLVVALPAMVAHSYLSAQVERHEARLQDGTVLFLKSLPNHRS